MNSYSQMICDYNENTSPTIYHRRNPTDSIWAFSSQIADYIIPPNINVRLVLPFNAGINLGSKSYFHGLGNPLIRL